MALTTPPSPASRDTHVDDHITPAAQRRLHGRVHDTSKELITPGAALWRSAPVARRRGVKPIAFVPDQLRDGGSGPRISRWCSSPSSSPAVAARVALHRRDERGALEGAPLRRDCLADEDERRARGSRGYQEASRWRTVPIEMPAQRELLAYAPLKYARWQRGSDVRTVGPTSGERPRPSLRPRLRSSEAGGCALVAAPRRANPGRASRSTRPSASR
jgi:hypothetical protein